MIHPVPRKALVFPALAAAGLMAVLPAPLRSVDPKTAQKIDAAVEKVKPDVVKVRRFLHMNPELGNREVETAKLVASKLESLGLEVRTGVAKTGVVAVLRGAQPGAAVAVRADMDALPIQEATGLPYKSLNPGVMHACGHDVHTSIALGTAMVLATLKDHMKGSVTFIFQPSEEGAPENEEGGADVMVREGALENPTVGAIFALHVWPEDVGQVYFSPGNVTAAADYFWITVKGKSSHGARPQEGVDAIVMAAEIVQALQTIVSRVTDPTDPAVVTVGTIQGGTKANIIADSVLLGGTVRTMSEANRKKVPALLEAVVKNITGIYGGSYEFDYKPRVSSVYNNPELAAAMTPTLVRILGKDKVLEWKPQMIAEDFSAFSQRIPGFYFFLGVKNPAQAAMAPLHSPTFAPDERSIPLGMRLLANLLLDALEVQDSLVSGTPKI